MAQSGSECAGRSPGEVFGQSQHAGIGTYPGQRGLHGFLHHLADLPGHGEGAFAFHAVGLDKEDVAAGRRPGQAHRHPGPLHPFGDLGIHPHLDVAQALLEDFTGDNQLFFLAFDDPARLLAAYRADHLFEFAHARFAGVVADDVPHRVLGKFDLLRRDSVFPDLARNQEAARDVHLLLFAVALQRDQFHAVEQRRRYRVEHVGGTDKQHLERSNGTSR
jgi:hypothetical protein